MYTYKVIIHVDTLSPSQKYEYDIYLPRTHMYYFFLKYRIIFVYLDSCSCLMTLCNEDNILNNECFEIVVVDDKEAKAHA